MISSKWKIEELQKSVTGVKNNMGAKKVAFILG
jgi:hypothetical protein